MELEQWWFIKSETNKLRSKHVHGQTSRDMDQVNLATRFQTNLTLFVLTCFPT